MVAIVVVLTVVVSSVIASSVVVVVGVVVYGRVDGVTAKCSTLRVSPYDHYVFG